MIVRPHLHWFRLLFVWRGSVLPYITTRLLLVLLVAVASVLSRNWWMSEASGACERIANTPIPYTCRVLMKRTVMVCCLLLPIGLSTSIGWLTPLIATFVAYTFLAIDVIGEQIEEPFGTEPNDLALASMCHAIEVSVYELLGEIPRSQAPQVTGYVLT